MNEELYELLELEFMKHHIDEEVEDLLLILAESLADMKVTGKEVTYKEQAGDALLEICGICEADEDSPEEVSVYIKTFTIGEKEYEIEDFLL